MNMEQNESIYEEIMTRESEVQDVNARQLSHKLCAEGNKYHTSLEEAVKGLEMSADGEDSLYAVVNGENIEFKKLGDLLNTEEQGARRDLKFDDSEEGIAQVQPSNVEENDSGCDCSQMGKELLEKPTSLARRPNSLKLSIMNETVYSEILHLNPASQIDLKPARFTRESNNPILRQEVVSSNSASPCSSKPASRSGSFKRSGRGESTHSGSGDSGIQEDFPTAVVYGNCTSRPVSRKSSFNQVYVNASPAKTPDVPKETVYENVEEDKKSPTNSQLSAQSVYENLEEEKNRPRAASQPIAIQRKFGSLEQEILYSDLEFKGEINTESLSSSPGDGSSSSSWLSSSSNNFSNSMSPPPLPNRPLSVYSRRRQTSFSSVSMSSYSAANGLKAHFIGSQTVHRANTESINSAISDVAHKSSMLDIKSVSADVSKSLVCFGKLSPPYDCILQFSVDDVHILDKYSKDNSFFGIVVSKPGKEAVCYVLQSDQASEIIDMIKEVFRESTKRPRHSSPERPKSLYGLAENPQHNYFSGLIKIGSLKVKKTYLVINESITTLLEKNNPKDNKRVNIKIQETDIIVSNSTTGEDEEKHSVPWVLSLGLYNKDGRYFAFTVTRTKNGKTRMFCHVFRSNRALTSASILEGIRSACQSSLMHSQSATRMSRSMPRDGLRSSKQMHFNADAVSRSSTSSEETITSFDANSSSSGTNSPQPASAASPLENKKLLPGSRKDSPNNCSEDLVYGNVVSANTETKEATETQEKHSNEKGTSKERRATLFKGKLFRGNLNRKKTNSPKLSESVNSLGIDSNENEDVIKPVERKEDKFIISYLCSAVVNPPLKQKHVEKCLKQFQKEAGKKRKEGNSIGNVLMLEVISDDGVTMVDMRKPDAFRRHFPISTIDSFVLHPDDPNCFAFSTTVSGDQQRKYHVFYKEKESISLVKEAFDLLKQTQISLGV